MFGYIEDAARAVGGAISGGVKAVASVIADGSYAASPSTDSAASGVRVDADAAPMPGNDAGDGAGNALLDAGSEAQHVGFGDPGASDAYGSLMPESAMSLMESLANGIGFDLALAQHGLIPTTDPDMQQTDLSACALPDTHEPGCMGSTPTDAFTDASTPTPTDYLGTELHHHALH